MGHSKTVVVGVAGVIVGIAVGASSAQHAQTVSFSGVNPNAAVEQDGVDRTNAGVYFNNRRLHRGLEALDYVRDVRSEQAARMRERMHSAAEEREEQRAENCEIYGVDCETSEGNYRPSVRDIRDMGEMNQVED